MPEAPYLDFYKYWGLGPLPLEPIFIYYKSLATVPILAARGLVTAVCPLPGAAQRARAPWRWP